MPSFTVRETLHHPRPEVYDLVADIERYPEFVPGWKEARILWEEENRRAVEQRVRVHGFVWRLRTEAVLERPDRIRIEGNGGPVRRLRQIWRFEEREPNATWVELWTDYALAGGPMAAVAGPFFQRRTEEVVAAFHQRADALLGASG